MKRYEPAMSFGEDAARLDRDFQRGDEKAAIAFFKKPAGSGSFVVEAPVPAFLYRLRLKSRWGGWDGEPFNCDSNFHVSVYGH